MTVALTRRRGLAVLAATVALVAALELLLFALYRSERGAVAGALDDRLSALGRTAARLMDGVDPAALLSALADENALEDAILVDGELVILAAARTAPGQRLNLLRVEAARIAAALAGRASVADGYRVEDHAIRSGVFPAGGGRALILEAGAEYLRPVSRLAFIYGAAAALSLVLGALFSVGLLFALRALERARVAHGLATVGQMAAMVAHEVRNPLGILRGQVELLRERLPAETAARERERLADMLAEVERLGRVTEELLSLARESPLDLGEVELGELVAETAQAARLHPAAAAATVDPIVAERVTVRGDAARLRQAILNLVLNALQAGAATVTVSAQRAGGQGRVVVSDDGPGVPAALRDTLFEPFVGARPGGSGLGLAVAQRIAERHGGRLSLGEAGPGATFTLTLPAEER